MNGTGTSDARRAVASYHAKWDRVTYTEDDIVLTHGVGQALDIIFSVLVPHSSFGPSNVLIPRPGFSQYASLLAALGTEIRYYDCLEEHGWQVDLKMLDSLCDDNTRTIILTNPSNPCGSNYTLQHLEDFLAIAEKYKVPVVADEIYGHMTWSSPFVPLASLSKSVPVITLSGLSKRFLLPGWRVGWACLHDPLNVADSVRTGMTVWGNRFFGPSSIVQSALPEILDTPGEWFDQVNLKIRNNASILQAAVNEVVGLHSNMPEGAMYMLVRIDPGYFDLGDDLDFCTALYREEAVFVLPGLCFGAPGYLRLVLGTPDHITRDVADRLRSFGRRHAL